MASTPITNHKTPLKIISLNARGLNIPEKRSQLLLTMQRNKADIVFLQEMRLRKDSILKLTNCYYFVIYHATNQTAKAKGVSILLAKDCPLKISDTLLDLKRADTSS